MDQIGFVEKIEKNIATIMVRRASACGENCSSCNGTCNIKGIRIDTVVDGNIRAGEYVEIQSETTNILKYAFIAYFIPLLIMIIAITLSLKLLEFSALKEAIAVANGMISLLLSSFILKRIDALIEKSDDIKYIIKRKL